MQGHPDGLSNPDELVVAPILLCENFTQIYISEELIKRQKCAMFHPSSPSSLDRAT